MKKAAIPHAETPPPARRRPGRPPRPPRCVVQVFRKNAGKTYSIVSFTVDCEPYEAMKRIQTAFAGLDRVYSRSTDDPRWSSEGMVAK